MMSSTCSDAEVRAVLATDFSSTGILRATLAATSAECRRCVFSTILLICGEGFIEATLNLVVEDGVLPVDCLREISTPVAARQPIGFSAAECAAIARASANSQHSDVLQQPFEVLIQSRQIRALARKPSDTNATVNILLHAGGNQQLLVSMVANRGRSRRVHTSANVVTRSWSGVIQSPSWRQRSLDVFHVSLGIAVPMSGQRAFSTTSNSVIDGYALQIYLDCSGQGSSNCVEDGDLIDLNVQFHTVGDASDVLRSSVNIVTEVQSQISCEHSSAWLTRGNPGQSSAVSSIAVSASAQISIRICDVDQLPINFTQAEIECRFGGVPLSQIGWNPGSNEYTAEIPSSMTSVPGEYELVVLIQNGWSLGQAAKCTLLEQSVTVAAGFDTTRILGGAALVALAVILALLLMVRRRYGSSLAGMCPYVHAATIGL